MHTMNVLPKLSLISTVVVASLFLSGCGEDDKTDSPVILKTAFNQSEKILNTKHWKISVKN